MPVIYDKQNSIFNLQTPDTSYIIGIYENKLPIHIHYGKRLNKTYDMEKMLDLDFSDGEGFCVNSVEFEKPISLTILPLEFPTYGSGDYRTPVFHAQYEDGSTVSKFYYDGHKIYDGKPKIDGLPATYVESDSEAQTLELYLKDDLTGVRVVIRYTVYNNRNVITRSHTIINGGNGVVKLKNVMSGCIDFPDMDYEFVTFNGAWARERFIKKNPLFPGKQSVESLRGSSSHFFNPFVCLASKNATEDYGDVYGINLVYSGNFESGVYVDTQNRTRLYTGINPFDFEWKLEVGECFNTPECVMVYSDSGFCKLSHTYHELIRNRLCRGKYRDKERPVLINNWEATYFDFNEEKIVNIAKKAAEAGIELMVLDDGWFGKRNDAHTSLGDWYVNKEKLPDGIDGLAEKVNKLGLKFGLWFEPEMISEVSRLYEKHPDWCLHVDGRSRSLGRNQLVLDYSRDDVCDYIIETLSDIFSKANIGYIKWDMNRNMSEIGSAILPADRQRETAHRYMLGLYRVLDTLKSRFPDILMEGCSGGGGRFDMGMFYYFDQFWTSDDSDAVERQYIQTGTSYCYPLSVMGAHVSAVPNHQIHRTVDIDTRAIAAYPGQFGYELDLGLVSDEEFEKVKEQVKLYKNYGKVFHRGDMYRIKSPFEDNMTAWEFISDDGNTVILEIFMIKGIPSSPKNIIKLKGLEENCMYKDELSGKVYSGEVLMNIGLKRGAYKDYMSEIMIFKKI